MKKNSILILIVVLIMNFKLEAQTISIGPAVGFGHSFISADNVESQFHPSFAAGLSLTYSSVEHSGFGADLLYSMEGSTTENNIAGIMIKNEVNLTYLRLPIRIIYFWGEFGDPVRPKVFVGPTMGFLMAAEAGSIDTKDQYNGFDLGLHGGLGANFQLGERAWLNTDITYTQGLTDITKSDFGEDVNRNGNLRLNVGLLFGLGN